MRHVGAWPRGYGQTFAFGMHIRFHSLTVRFARSVRLHDFLTQKLDGVLFHARYIGARNPQHARDFVLGDVLKLSLKDELVLKDSLNELDVLRLSLR